MLEHTLLKDSATEANITIPDAVKSLLDLDAIKQVPSNSNATAGDAATTVDATQATATYITKA